MPTVRTLFHQTLPSLLKEIGTVCYTLFKIMIPVILVVKLLEELGAIPLIAKAMASLMVPLGLPESMGLVWATTILTNIYGGMLVFFQLAPTEQLTIAQVSILGTLMLLAHNLPIEVRIAQRAGVRFGITLAVRLLGALLLGFLLNQIYLSGDWLQQPAILPWSPTSALEPRLLDWAIAQGESLLMIVVVIAALLTLLRLLRWLRIERLMIWLLKPLLRLMGIAPQATSLTIIGITLGLAYGGGLLIREAESGRVDKRDIFAALTLLGLCHSLIEDTLLIMAMGADLSAILWARLAFTLVLVSLLSRWMRFTSPDFQQRFLVQSVSHPSSKANGAQP